MTEQTLDRTVKIHLILKGWAICNSVIREAGRQAVTTPKAFHALPAEATCCKCAKTLAKLERAS